MALIRGRHLSEGGAYSDLSVNDAALTRGWCLLEALYPLNSFLLSFLEPYLHALQWLFSLAWSETRSYKKVVISKFMTIMLIPIEMLFSFCGYHKIRVTGDHDGDN